MSRAVRGWPYEGKPLSLKMLTHYEAQLEDLSKKRARMRELLAIWWTLREENPH